MVSNNLDSKKIDLTNAVELCLEKIYTNNTYDPPSFVFEKKINESLKNENDYKHYYPQILQWRIISDCNLRCKHCLFHEFKDKFNSNNDLSTPEILDIIDILADEFNLLNVNLTGGEVFLRKDIFEILKKLKSKNIAVSMSTNGTLITKEIAQKLKTILNTKIDNIKISLDGATKETHDKTRGTGAFQAAINGINNLVENGIIPSISYTVTSYNIDELPEFYKLVNDLKVKRLTITRFYLCSNEQEYLVPDINDFMISLAELIKMEKQGDKTPFRVLGLMPYHFVVHEIAQKILPKYINEQNIVDTDCMCHRHNKIDIEPDGKVFLCDSLAHREQFCLGSIKDESLIDIWSKRHNNIFFQKRDPHKMVCKKCKVFSICRGGCCAKAYETYGDINAPNGFCELGKKLMENKGK